MRLPWRKKAALPKPRGITMNDGKPMRLVTIFDRIAICDGAIELRGSESGALLLVPSDARAFLTGCIMDSLEDPVWSEDGRYIGPTPIGDIAPVNLSRRRAHG